MEKTIWISYDLGVNGDYENLYAWLDNKKALDCGNGVAVLRHEIKKGNDVFQILKRELEDCVSFNKRSRIYAICKNEDKAKGKFIIGRRKSAPWVGFGNHDEQEGDVSE